MTAGRRRVPRIIPAHAGFTSARPSVTSVSPDHPRTRGVYSARTEQCGDGEGSSPHTRGLRVRVCACVRRCGIIPAHAGFTVWVCALPRPARDHPRTRGVYGRGVRPGCGGPGSSPHTRGLPRRAPCGPTRRGIIPAHAGFTACPWEDGSGRRDHPRTRGVYPVRAPATIITVRIIPAHAGFTAPGPVLLTPTADHPRTRGVY